MYAVVIDKYSDWGIVALFYKLKDETRQSFCAEAQHMPGKEWATRGRGNLCLPVVEGNNAILLLSLIPSYYIFLGQV